jgi:DNA-binding transcriptional ArsR family regulator
VKAISEIDDPRLVKALAHPLRLRILGILEDRVASPSELAEELEAPLGNVSYHVRILAGFDLIRLVRKRPRRGAIEHYYKARGRVELTDRAWSKVPTIVKGAIVDATLDQIGELVESAAQGGGFDRADARLCRQPLSLDATGWRELASAVDELLGRAEEIERESAERLAANDHRGELDAGLVVMLFESATGRAAGGEPDRRPPRGAGRKSTNGARDRRRAPRRS